MTLTWDSFAVSIPSDEDIDALFKLFDKDKSGTISHAELALVLRGMGQNPTETELAAMFSEADQDDSGSIDYEEFKPLILSKWKSNQADEIKGAFQALDRDANGTIERHELKHVLMNSGRDPLTEIEVEELLEDMLFEADMNRDGKIDYADHMSVIEVPPTSAGPSKKHLPPPPVFNITDDCTPSVCQAVLDDNYSHFLSLLAEYGTDEYDCYGKNPLAVAAEYGRTDMVRAILSEDTIVDCKDVGGFTPLMWACYKNHVEVVRMLLIDGHANPNVVAEQNMTCLMWAAGRGYVDVCKALVMRRANINATDKFGSTALLWACRNSQTDVVEYLLSQKADPNPSGMDNMTCLLFAVSKGATKIVDLLLHDSHNIAQDVKDAKGLTPLMIAAANGRAETMRLLLRTGRTLVNAADPNGFTAFHHAVSGRHIEAVRLLLDFNVNVDAQNNEGKTGLYLAVTKEDPDLVELLLTRANHNMELAALDSTTALIKATRMKNSRIVKLLLDHKAKVSTADREGNTALHHACAQHSRRIIQQLLQDPRHSKLLYRPNKRDETPFMIDQKHTAPLVQQIFGTKNLNQAEIHESMHGYDLYSSSLAVMLSEPSLTTPITVGLFARWGSGKSFVIKQLKDTMKSYTHQYSRAIFRFRPQMFAALTVLALVCAEIAGLASNAWVAPIVTFISIVAIPTAILMGIRYLGAVKRVQLFIDLGVSIKKAMTKAALLFRIVFENPRFHCGLDGKPLRDEDFNLSAEIRFVFVQLSRFHSRQPNQLIAFIVARLFEKLESEYGRMVTILLMIMRPPKWPEHRFRRVCCVPLIILASLWLGCLMVNVALIVLFWPPFGYLMETHTEVATTTSPGVTDVSTRSFTTQTWSTVSALFVVLSVISLIGICAWLWLFAHMLYALISPEEKRILRLAQQILSSESGSVQPGVLTGHQTGAAAGGLANGNVVGGTDSEAFVSLIQHSLSMLEQIVVGVDVLANVHTRFVVILDELDNYDQGNIVATLDNVNRHLLETSIHCPFILLLAVDPHIIIRHLDEKMEAILYEGSNMSGNDYLRNVVQLPIFLATRSANFGDLKPTLFSDKNVHKSVSGGGVNTQPGSAMDLSTSRTSLFRKPTLKKRARNDSIVVPEVPTQTTGIEAIDYFSDINPRTLTRIRNTTALMARLLYSQNVYFHWSRLSNWVNLTEQWPFNVTRMLYWMETSMNAPATLDPNQPLSVVYNRAALTTPSEVANQPNTDRNVKKLISALEAIKPPLTVQDAVNFSPYSVNIDPFLHRVIRDSSSTLTGSLVVPPPSSAFDIRTVESRSGTNHSVRAFEGTADKLQPGAASGKPGKDIAAWTQKWLKKPLWELEIDELKIACSSLPYLSKRGVEQVNTVLSNDNLNGFVLSSCEVVDLKDVFRLNFGDWSIFQLALKQLIAWSPIVAIQREDNAFNPKPSKTMFPLQLPLATDNSVSNISSQTNFTANHATSDVIPPAPPVPGSPTADPVASQEQRLLAEAFAFTSASGEQESSSSENGSKRSSLTGTVEESTNAHFPTWISNIPSSTIELPDMVPEDSVPLLTFDESVSGKR